jgi:hypothetical protein
MPMPKPLPKTERVSVEYVEKSIDKEEILKNIENLTKYLEDLKAGRPVENMSPSNDPFFLEPANIASMIRGLKDMLEGKGRIVNSIKDIIGEWDTE